MTLERSIRNAIVRSGVTLQAAVRWALPDADFRGR